MKQPIIICLDLEGVLVPEVWISLAEATKIDTLRLTTRDISDYDELMKKRLDILNAHSLRIQDIHAAVETLTPLEGAVDFLKELRSKYQVIILSDTFSQLALRKFREAARARRDHEIVLEIVEGIETVYRVKSAKHFKHIFFPTFLK